jgi:hypothetical protein
MHIIYNTSRKIKKIISISDYEDWFITFQTNIGEEYTDLKELVNNSTFDGCFINRFTNALNNLYLKDIKLESRWINDKAWKNRGRGIHDFAGNCISF